MGKNLKSIRKKLIKIKFNKTAAKIIIEFSWFILLKLEMSEYEASYGKYSGFICLFLMASKSRSLNQGWDKISFTSFFEPRRSATDFYKHFEMKSWQSGDMGISCFLGSGKNTFPVYINSYVLAGLVLPV